MQKDNYLLLKNLKNTESAQLWLVYISVISHQTSEVGS